MTLKTVMATSETVNSDTLYLILNRSTMNLTTYCSVKFSESDEGLRSSGLGRVPDRRSVQQERHITGHHHSLRSRKNG